MGKKKVAKSDKPEPVSAERVTWAQVFNANDRTLEDVSGVARRAHDCCYKFFAFLNTLWFTTGNTWLNLSTPIDELVAGVLVGFDAAGLPCDVRPGQRAVWVVVDRGMEYDDEAYSRTDGGDPVAVYHTEAGAEAAARRLNVLMANQVSGELFDYFKYYEDTYSGIFEMSWYALIDLLREQGLTDNDFANVPHDTEPTFGQLSAWWSELRQDKRAHVIPHMSLPFYHVTQVHAEG